MEIDQSIREQYSEEVYLNALSIFYKNHVKLLGSKKELGELKSLYHKIKGGAGMLGLTTIFEVATHGENNPEVEDYMHEMETLFKRLAELIEE